MLWLRYRSRSEKKWSLAVRISFLVEKLNDRAEVFLLRINLQPIIFSRIAGVVSSAQLAHAGESMQRIHPPVIDEFFAIHARYFNVDVNAVKQRTSYLFSIFRYQCRRNSIAFLKRLNNRMVRDGHNLATPALQLCYASGILPNGGWRQENHAGPLDRFSCLMIDNRQILRVQKSKKKRSGYYLNTKTYSQTLVIFSYAYAIKTYCLGQSKAVE
jgi:hypothetical protein